MKLFMNAIYVFIIYKSTYNINTYNKYIYVFIILYDILYIFIFILFYVSVFNIYLY